MINSNTLVWASLWRSNESVLLTGHVLDQEEINEIVEFVAKNEIYLLYEQLKWTL